jgi:hypothetical protein
MRGLQYRRMQRADSRRAGFLADQKLRLRQNLKRGAGVIGRGCAGGAPLCVCEATA